MNPLNFLVNLLYPRRCLSCGKFGRYFCDNCRITIRKTLVIEENICPICEKIAFGGLTHPDCRSRFTLDGLSSVFVYQGIIREAIRLLKYKKVRDLIPEFTKLIIQTLKPQNKTTFRALEQYIQKERPLTIPLPLHWWRRRTRWFNQSELLGKPLASHWNLELRADILKRVKLKKPQYKLKEKERQENIKGAFSVNKNIVISKYRNILLLDDVWTTGSTIKEAARTLKRAGAKKVWGLTMAR